MRPRIVALALLFGVAACDNRDEEFEQEIRDICSSLTIGSTTLLEGRQAFGEFEVFIDCRSDYAPLANQTCAEGPVCQLRWQFQTTGNCGPGGCALVCEVRTADVNNGAQPPASTTICARRFLDQQPFVF
jgi:hypothetical protein